MRIREQESNYKSMQFLNLFIIFFLLITAIIVILLIHYPVEIFTILSKFNVGIIKENKIIILLSLPLFVFMVTTIYLNDIIRSYKFFTIPMITSVINNSFSLLFIFFFHDRLNVMSIILGLTSGYILNFSLLLYFMINKLKWTFSINLRLLKKGTLSKILYSLFGNFTATFAQYIPAYLLSSFSGGIISAFHYGKTLSNLPNNLITIHFSNVVNIKFNELCAKNDLDQLNQIFLTSLKFLLFILVPLSGVMYLYSEEMISLIYKRGEFDLNVVENTSLFLKFLGLILPFFAINSINGAIFKARQKIKEAFYYQVFTNALLILFIYVGIKLFGIMGFLLFYVLQRLLVSLIVYFIIKKLFKFIDYLKVLKYFFIVVFINIVILFGLYLLKGVMINCNNFTILIVGVFLYIIILLIINWIFRVNRDVTDLILKTRNINNILRTRHGN